MVTLGLHASHLKRNENQDPTRLILKEQSCVCNNCNNKHLSQKRADNSKSNHAEGHAGKIENDKKNVLNKSNNPLSRNSSRNSLCENSPNEINVNSQGNVIKVNSNSSINKMNSNNNINKINCGLDQVSGSKNIGEGNISFQTRNVIIEQKPQLTRHKSKNYIISQKSMRQLPSLSVQNLLTPSEEFNGLYRGSKKLSKSDDSLLELRQNKRNFNSPLRKKSRDSLNETSEYPSSDDEEFMSDSMNLNDTNNNFNTLSSSSSYSITTEANCDFDFYHNNVNTVEEFKTNLQSGKNYNVNGCFNFENRNFENENFPHENFLIRNFSNENISNGNFAHRNFANESYANENFANGNLVNISEGNFANGNFNVKFENGNFENENFKIEDGNLIFYSTHGNDNISFKPAVLKTFKPHLATQKVIINDQEPKLTRSSSKTSRNSSMSDVNEIGLNFRITRSNSKRSLENLQAYLDENRVFFEHGNVQRSNSFIDNDNRPSRRNSYNTKHVDLKRFKNLNRSYDSFRNDKPFFIEGVNKNIPSYLARIKYGGNSHRYGGSVPDFKKVFITEYI